MQQSNLMIYFNPVIRKFCFYSDTLYSLQVPVLWTTKKLNASTPEEKFLVSSSKEVAIKALNKPMCQSLKDINSTTANLLPSRAYPK